MDGSDAHGLKPMIAQATIGFNVKRGALRGIHFEEYPRAAETKLVRCRGGGILVRDELQNALKLL